MANTRSPNIVQWLLPQLFFCLNLAGVIVYAVTASSLETSLHLSTAQVGSIGGSYFITYAVSQLLLGACFGSVSPRLLLGITAMIAAVGTFLLSMAQSFEVAMLARLLMGIGFGTAMVGVVYMVSRLFSNKFALMVNVSQSIANAVGAMLGLLAPLPLFQDFRLPFLLTAILLFANGLLILLFLQGDNQAIKGAEPSGRTATLAQALATILSNGQFWMGTIYFSGLFASFLAYADLWNIRFQIDFFGRSSALAAMINSGVAWGLTIGGVATGIWANRVGFVLPARISAWAALILLGILYTRPLGSPAVYLMLALGFFLGAAPLGLAAMNAHVPEKFQVLAAPMLLTVVFLTGGLLMSNVGSSLASLPTHAFSTYQTALNWFLVPIAVAAVASLMLKPGRPTAR